MLKLGNFHKIKSSWARLNLKISLLSFHIPFSQSKLHASFCLAQNSVLFRGNFPRTNNFLCPSWAQTTAFNVQYIIEYFQKKVQFPEKRWEINQAK